MNISEAKAFLTDFHEQRKLNSRDATECFFAEDPCFSIAGMPRANSIAVQIEGREAFDGSIELLLSQWHWMDVDFKNVLVDEDLIVCRYDLTLKHMPTDCVVTTEVVDS